MIVLELLLPLPLFAILLPPVTFLRAVVLTVCDLTVVLISFMLAPPPAPAIKKLFFVEVVRARRFLVIFVFA